MAYYIMQVKQPVLNNVLRMGDEGSQCHAINKLCFCGGEYYLLLK